jgi:hypothetical protein
MREECSRETINTGANECELCQQIGIPRRLIRENQILLILSQIYHRSLPPAYPCSHAISRPC